MVRSAFVQFFIGLMLTPGFVLAETECQIPRVTDSEILVRHFERANAKLLWMVPATLLAIFLLL